MAKSRTKEERDLLFSEAPVAKALATMAIPTIISQLINLIYSMADTFFVGRTGNPFMIAAVSLAFTLFMLNIPISGLFGIGGGSYIARLIGLKEYDRVKRSSAFCFYGALALVLFYSMIVLIFMDPILDFLGASPDTVAFAKQYVWVVVIIGNIPTVLSLTLSHLLRNTGYSSEASFGLSMGGILNIILDPLFMFVILPDGYQVMGAALATTLSNTVSLIYFLIIFRKTQAETGLSVSLKDCRIDKEDFQEIFRIGIPSALTTLLMDFANMFLNSSMASHGDLQLAALGIDLKIERLSNAICLGIAQAMLPLVAFNYSTKNYKRMKAFLNAGRMAGLVVAAVSILFYQLCAKGLVNFFISSKGSNTAQVATTVAFGIVFLRIRCLAAPFSMLNFISTNGFQATGDGRMSLIQVFFRQIVFYLPLLFLMNRIWGPNGLMAAYPVAEVLSAAISTVLLVIKLKKVRADFQSQGINC